MDGEEDESNKKSLKAKLNEITEELCQEGRKEMTRRRMKNELRRRESGRNTRSFREGRKET